jgi:hypothetical protein
VPYQFAVRVTCPQCGHDDGQLRVAFPYRERHRQHIPVVVLFYCINDGNSDHVPPSDAELLAQLPDYVQGTELDLGLAR